MEEIEKREKETRDWHLREVFAWLDLDGRDREQDDLLDRYVNNRELYQLIGGYLHVSTPARLPRATPGPKQHNGPG
jgi:hypothetical protein